MFGKPAVQWHFRSLMQVYHGFLVSQDIYQSYKALNQVLDRFTKQVVDKEPLVFSNLFSRLSFICQKYRVEIDIQSFRILMQDIENYDSLCLSDFFMAYWSDVNLFISQVYQIPVWAENQQFLVLTSQRIALINHKDSQGIELLKVTFLYWEQSKMICQSQYDSNTSSIAVYPPKVQGKSIFASLKSLWNSAALHLLDVKIDSNGHYHPSVVIIEPDYLLDVSSVAECFQDYGFSELHFLKSKLQSALNTVHILIGNFANLVMDEVINGNTQTTQGSFNSVFQKHFQNYPLEHLLCKDIQSKQGFEMYQSSCQAHFQTILKVVNKDFSVYGLNHAISAQLEPSFLSNVYGLQGRLDLLHYNATLDKKLVVVELKSGGGPYPDTGSNVKANHSSQLFMYYMMLAQVVGLPLLDLLNGKGISGFIFYSKLPKNNMRSAYLNLESLQEICEMRNAIILNERILQSGDFNKISLLFHNLRTEHLVTGSINGKFRGILDQQFKQLIAPVFNNGVLCQVYFFGFYSFIAREQNLSKVGDSLHASSNSLSGLWNRDFDQKKDSFSIIYDLKIFHNALNTSSKRIVFEISNKSDFSSFRVSDVCVLYPFYPNNKKPTSYPIVKCSIISISLTHIEVECRYMQSNLNYFNKHQKWALERDFMDSSYTSMYRNLYKFLQASESTKNLLLTKSVPKRNSDYGFYKAYLSIEQNRILNNMLSTKDYFILNGPPGTGKTSHIIKEFISEIYTKTKQSILVVSFTNKAVDELSQAVIEAVGSNKGAFIRLGNRLSCLGAYQPYLLESVIQDFKAKENQGSGKFTRGTLKEILSEQRIFLSTVSTMASKDDFLDFKKFDWVIVDEASQILEPQIVGVLAKCKRFVLIGDHKQLPAIVLQDSLHSKTDNRLLESIGLSSFRNSLFERLFNFVKRQNISYAYDTLTYQGRMHQEICEFPNQAFYSGKLKPAAILSNLSLEGKRALKRQISPMFYKHWPCDGFMEILASKRVLFFNCQPLEESQSKTLQQEADLVLKTIRGLIELHRLNNRDFDLGKQVGIIAPFKNQIALIYRTLLQGNIAKVDSITIDTVERFQGGQKDFIIYAFSVSDILQMQSIVNLNDSQDVDRKLNVALTRAKEQLILIGNSDILMQDPLHARLLDYIQTKQGFYTM